MTHRSDSAVGEDRFELRDDAQPGRCSSPPRTARLPPAWHRYRRLTAVGTIALQQCLRRAGVAFGGGAPLSLGESTCVGAGTDG